MLNELRIRNFGVIAEATIEFAPGLTALTGETGAGKTMVVAGLGQLLGARAEAGVVRHGTQKALVEGRWRLREAALEAALAAGGELDEGELLTVRQISSSGRSRALVGGAQTPVGVMAALLGDWATIHGQSEQTRLGSLERQREVLDEFAKPADLDTYRKLYAKARAKTAELRSLQEDSLARAREIDLLVFGLNEIEQVDPAPDEDHELAREAARLQAADDLRLLAQRIQTVFAGGEDSYTEPGVLGLLGQARKAGEQLVKLDETTGDLANRINELAFLADDLSADLSSYLADLSADPLRLESVTERQAALSALTRKYGRDINEVLDWGRQAGEKLDRMQGSDEQISALTRELAQFDQELEELANRLTRARTKAAAKLTKQVQAELSALAMPNARLEFVLTPLEERNSFGADKVELLFAANKGGGLAPLGKVASGGELSRVRLALEVVLAAGSTGHTFVFDEVDSGVGGAVGLEIGRRLKRLAQSSQVIVVTHLAQVAAFADRQFVVTKSSNAEVTSSNIVTVEGRARAEELARMMAGLGDSSAALDHALDLLKTTDQYLEIGS